jgi:hypothetical protein
MTHPAQPVPAVAPAASGPPGLGAWALLLQAATTAQELGRPPWAFAVELDCLLAEGLTPGELRRLIAQGLVEHGIETTRPGQQRRTFRRIANLSLPHGCFAVPTAKGIAYARAQLAAGQAPPAPLAKGRSSDPASGRTLRPTWDGKLFELRLGGLLVKRFPENATNQILVVTACAEQH